MHWYFAARARISRGSSSQPDKRHAMIRCATITGEQANRRHVTLANGTGYWRSDLLISAEGDSPAPQAFKIEQDPGTVIRPHFHAQDQFQVVAEGGGTLGRHAVAPIHVHYASRHTG